MQDYSAYYGTACIIFSALSPHQGVQRRPAAKRRSFHDAGSSLCLWNRGVDSADRWSGIFRPNLPWWGYRLIFPGTTMLFPAIIYLVGRRPPKPEAWIGRPIAVSHVDSFLSSSLLGLDRE